MTWHHGLRTLGKKSDISNINLLVLAPTSLLFLGFLRRPRREIRDVAEATGVSVLKLIPVLANQIFRMVLGESERDVDKAVFFSVATELQLYFMHLVDRHVYGRVGIHRRDIFMDHLMEVMEHGLVMKTDSGKSYNVEPGAVLSVLKCDTDLEREPGKRLNPDVGTFRELANARSREYSQYRRLVADPGEGTAGVLSWQFAKKICFLCSSQPNPVAFDFVAIQTTEAYITLLRALKKLGY
jgi:hypothetical protein